MLIYETEIKSEMQEDFWWHILRFGFEDARDCVTKNVSSFEKVRWAPRWEPAKKRGLETCSHTGKQFTQGQEWAGKQILSSAPRQELSTADIFISAAPERRVQLLSAWAQDLQNFESHILLSCWVCGHLSCSHRKWIHVGTFTM